MMFGINAHVPSKSDINKCASAKFKWVRIDINWFMIEKSKGVYNWGSIDSAISYAKSKGLLVYASIAYTPAWLNSNHRKCPDAVNWQDFCRAVASRYKSRIDVYGLWNEPNLKEYFRGSIKDYVEKILKPGYNAVKSVSPNLIVAGGELSTASGSSWTSWFSAMAKNKKYFDVFAWHLYQGSATSDSFRFRFGKWPVLGWLIPKWRPISWYLSSVKSGKRTMLTEVGLKAKPTSQKEMKAQLEFVKKLDSLRKSTKSEAIFYYDLKDNRSFKDKWGLFDDDGNSKLAGEYLQTK